MENNYIHYVKRKVILNAPDDLASPFYAELQVYDSGFDVPKFHVTRAKSWPVQDIKEDDVIWIVGQLSAPAHWGKFPPAIDGKIVVGEIEELIQVEEKSKIRFSAKEGSAWFPLVDATGTLSNLEVVFKDGRVSYPYNPKKDNLGQAFQSIRKIHNSNLLKNWTSEILKKKMEFISYRIADGTKSAFFKAKQRVELGNSVFWDRWSLPRRLAERRELVSDEALDNLLTNKIVESALVWGIESPRYNEEGSYSQKEKELSVKLNKYNSSTAMS